MVLIDKVGMRFGRIVVLERAPNLGEKVRWLCLCDCGRTVLAHSTLLKRNKSCGCARGRMPRHGHSAMKTTTYKTWKSMWWRCRTKQGKAFRLYGARGIVVCDRWRSFENFLDDMGERPQGMTIDRYPDNNGNYEPGNCRWATAEQQMANRRPSSEWR